MFWLPRELIDYIWSFDDNIINKTWFNKCIKELGVPIVLVSDFE